MEFWRENTQGTMLQGYVYDTADFGERRPCRRQRWLAPSGSIPYLEIVGKHELHISVVEGNIFGIQERP